MGYSGGDGREGAERPEIPKEGGEGAGPDLGADFMEAGGNILSRGVAPEDMALQHLSQLVLCHVGKLPAGEAEGRKAGHGMPGQCWAKPLQRAGGEAAKWAPGLAIPMFLPSGEAVAEGGGRQGLPFPGSRHEAKEEKAGHQRISRGQDSLRSPGHWSDYDSPLSSHIEPTDTTPHGHPSVAQLSF